MQKVQPGQAHPFFTFQGPGACRRTFSSSASRQGTKRLPRQVNWNTARKPPTLWHSRFRLWEQSLMFRLLHLTNRTVLFIHTYFPPEIWNSSFVFIFMIFLNLKIGSIFLNPKKINNRVWNWLLIHRQAIRCWGPVHCPALAGGWESGGRSVGGAAGPSLVIGNRRSASYH